MSLLATIVNEANSKTLPFLVIGGHAVNAHGFSRFTKDVDFLVRRENSREWEGSSNSLRPPLPPSRWTSCW